MGSANVTKFKVGDRVRAKFHRPCDGTIVEWKNLNWPGHGYEWEGHRGNANSLVFQPDDPTDVVGGPFVWDSLLTPIISGGWFQAFRNKFNPAWQENYFTVAGVLYPERDECKRTFQHHTHSSTEYMYIYVASFSSIAEELRKVNALEALPEPSENDVAEAVKEIHQMVNSPVEAAEEVTHVPAPPLQDLKAALSSSVKPDITHIRTPMMNYGARNCEYGNDKYERANYLRPVADLPAAFRRYRSYLRAAMSHLVRNLDAMEKHQSMDPNLLDIEGLKRAAFAVDDDPDLSGKVGPSMLPNIGGTVASLNMAIAQAVDAGLLPADPGCPWKGEKK